MYGLTGRCMLAALAIALTACSSLPRVNPDLAQRSSAQIRVDTEHGTLSAARSQAVLDALTRRTPNATLLDRHLVVEEAVAGTPLVAGNRVTLLQDGPATYEAMFAAIAAARDHVHVETYIVEDDEVGRRFADMLIGKQREGVQVHLIYDSVGALNTPAEYFERLSAAGVGVLQFNPINPLTAKAGWNVNQRDHRKLMVIDGHTAFVGGINISGVYSSGPFGSGRSRTAQTPARQPGRPLPWRDTHLKVEGPVVADFQRLFIETWTKQKGPQMPQRAYFPALQPRGKEVVRALGGAPDQPFNAIYVTLISAIQSAEREVLLTNAYFAPDPQLRQALKDAVARGVEVSLILPSTTDSTLVFHAGRSYYRNLLAAGVRIHERQDALLHSKTAVIDGVWSTVGSTNLDWRSFLHNQEINAVVLGDAFGAQMKAVFALDLQRSREITLEEWNRRPWSQRIKESLARVWEYWL